MRQRLREPVSVGGVGGRGGVDVRLQDVPLTNRRSDVVVSRADTLHITPTRPEHVLLVVEVVHPVRRPPTGS